MRAGNKLLQRAQKKVHVDSKDAGERASVSLHRLGDHATSFAQSIAEQAAATVVSGAERAKETGAVIGVAVQERAPQVSQVPQKVTEEVVPALRDVAVQAASLALELWQTARERASDAGESARHDLAPHAANLVSSAEKRAEEATHLVAHKAEAALSRTRDVSRHAAQATVDTSKDSGAILFWAGAATGIVLFALMSRERRDQLLKLAESSMGQIRDVVRDFQGYDEELTSTA